MYGSQTPQYDGSRTPHYGGMTPARSDGSRTPGPAGAWDPTVSNTPSRSTDYGDMESWEDPSHTYQPPMTPGSAYHSDGPRTPGSAYHMESPSKTPRSVYHTDSPIGMPYSPHTPSGSSFCNESNYSASPVVYQPSPSPIYEASVNTSSGMGYHSMGNSEFSSPSPSNYNPMTPGRPPSPPHPYTPGAEMDPTLADDWHTTDIEVRFKELQSSSAGLAGQVCFVLFLLFFCKEFIDESIFFLSFQFGIIRGISGGMCSVFLPAEDRTVTVAGDMLEPVVPVRKDRIKIISGEERESTGQLLSIDHHEGVVKLDSGDMRMFLMRHLCKLSGKKFH